MTNYTMWTDQIGDNNESDFCPRFTFEAKDQEDANEKAFGWAVYQGFTTQEVSARITEGDQLTWQLHNEYVS